MHPDERGAACYARLILSDDIQIHAIAQSIELHANNGAMCPVPTARHRFSQSIPETNDPTISISHEL